MSTENPRLRRAKKSRAKMAELHVTRLTVYRSNSNIYMHKLLMVITIG